MMNTPVVAVVGAGRWGRNILASLSSVPELCEIGMIVYSGNPDTVDFLTATYPTTPTSTNIADMLNNQSITHVFIATPIDTHASLAEQCLEAGKNCFVEKPLCLEADQALALHSLAGSNNLSLASGYVYLFDASLMALRDTLATSHDITLTCTWEKWGTFDSPLISNLLVHELAIANVLLGAFVAITTKDLSEHRLVVEIQYERGIATFTIDREQKDKKKLITATTTDATYTLENGRLIQISPEEKEMVQSDTSHLLIDELVAFIQNKPTFDWQTLDSEIATILRQLAS